MKPLLSASTSDVMFSLDPIEPNAEPVIVDIASQVSIENIDAHSGHPGVLADVQLTSDSEALLKLGLDKSWFQNNPGLQGNCIIEAEVTLETSFAGKSKVGPLCSRVPVQLAVEYDVELVPNTLSFGPGQLGATDSATVLLRSRSGSLFKVHVIEVSEQGVTVTRSKMASSLEHVFKVSKTISTIGRNMEFVKFSVEDDRAIPYTIHLRINSVGFQRGL